MSFSSYSVYLGNNNNLLSTSLCLSIKSQQLNPISYIKFPRELSCSNNNNNNNINNNINNNNNNNIVKNINYSNLAKKNLTINKILNTNC